MNPDKPTVTVGAKSLSQECRRVSTSKFFKDGVLGIAVLILVSGTLLLAVIDTNCRPMFEDLTQVCLGAYIGLLMPKR